MSRFRRVPFAHASALVLTGWPETRGTGRGKTETQKCWNLKAKASLPLPEVTHSPQICGS